jgi:hypothetical protein
MAHDPTWEVLMRAVLAELDPHAGDDALSYVDVCRRVQQAIVGALDTGPQAPTTDQERVVRQALDRIDPHTDDRYQPYAILLGRLQMVVDRELSRWTSAPAQPRSPSGGTAVAV